ncbi:MAG: hypothetical protein AMR96_00800 [Candidatus Adiutrix intracellularis]|jgi:hypothetical protein|nr:MAG: hypothetical protein AMR96_00800 [Candidatus Adiutrix intracellularis]MDR2827683.1 hypothetical protein [Candidatus Adiutrix intracellularis]
MGRNLDAALTNWAPSISTDALCAIIQQYKKLLQPDKYLSVPALVRDTSDPGWQKIAATKLTTKAPTGN